MTAVKVKNKSEQQAYYNNEKCQQYHDALPDSGRKALFLMVIDLLLQHCL